MCEQDLGLHKHLQKSWSQLWCILRETLKMQTQKSCFEVAICILHQMLIFIMKQTLIGCLQLVSHSRKNENYSGVRYWKIPLVASSHLPSVPFEWYFPWKEHLFCMKSEGRALPTEWTSCLLRLLWPTCAYFMRTDNTVNFQQAHLLGRDCCLSRMQFFQKPKRRRTFWVKQLPCY